MVIVMTTGEGVLTIEPIVMQSQITGGEVALPPLQPTWSRRQQKSHQSRRRRRSWTRSWRGQAALTSPPPSYGWCNSKSLTRAGELVLHADTKKSSVLCFSLSCSSNSLYVKKFFLSLNLNEKCPCDWMLTDITINITWYNRHTWCVQWCSDNWVLWVCSVKLK